MINDLLPGACVIFLVGFVESIAVGKEYANKHQYRLSANRELVAFGMSNITGGIMGCFPTFGSMSRSKIMDQTGARTQAAGRCFAALWVSSLSHMLLFTCASSGFHPIGQFSFACASLVFTLPDISFSPLRGYGCALACCPHVDLASLSFVVVRNFASIGKTRGCPAMPGPRNRQPTTSLLHISPSFQAFWWVSSRCSPFCFSWTSSTIYPRAFSQVCVCLVICV